MTKAPIDFDGSQLTWDEYHETLPEDRSESLEADYAFGIKDHSWLAGLTPPDGWWF